MKFKDYYLNGLGCKRNFCGIVLVSIYIIAQYRLFHNCVLLECKQGEFSLIYDLRFRIQEFTRRCVPTTKNF